MLHNSSNLRARGVSFDDSPLLVGRHDPSAIGVADNCHPTAVVGEIYGPSQGSPETGDADDSLEMVVSVETGAGRAHTPQRANRTHTPQRPRSSSLLHTAAAPVQAGKSWGEGDARRQPRGRRKQRRWENDNLIGVERFLRGRHSQEEGEASHLTVSHSWRSSLSILVSSQNTTADIVEARERVRNGVLPKNSAQQGLHNPGSRHFTGGKWADAEERFLLVERRLRDIVMRALRSADLMSFVSGLETLLEAFAQHRKVEATDVSAVLASSLTAPPAVENAGNKATGKSATESTLLVFLGPSPFHRLLLHALCQYWKLRSRSEETGEGRVVRVSTPPTSRKAFLLPDTFLVEFVVQARLRGETAPGMARCLHTTSTLTSDSHRAISKAVRAV